MSAVHMCVQEDQANFSRTLSLDMTSSVRNCPTDFADMTSFVRNCPTDFADMHADSLCTMQTNVQVCHLKQTKSCNDLRDHKESTI